jgi:hypothetical protein
VNIHYYSYAGPDVQALSPMHLRCGNEQGRDRHSAGRPGAPVTFDRGT